MKDVIWLIVAIGALVVHSRTMTMATDNLPLGCEYRFREENEVLCRGTFPDFDFRSQQSSANSTDDRVIDVSDLRVSDCEFGGIQKHHLTGVDKNLLIFQVACNYTGSGELAIERGTFADFAQLYIIRIQHGGFRSITPGIFCEVRELYELNLEHNRIADLADIGLSPSSQTSSSASSSCDVPHLSEITLAHNSIKVIRNDSLLCHLTHIGILDISDNGLEVIEPEAFVHLSQLSILNLQNNRLKRLSPRTFVGLSSVWALLLSNNLLDNDNWDDHVLHPLTDLMALYLGENLLSNIDSMFRNLSQLRELYLGANQISRVMFTTFAGTDDLKKLVLNDNRVTSVDEYAMSSNLLELQLNGNQLTNVRFLRNTCEKLVSLYLSDNQIVTLDNGLSRCYKLTKLRLDGNQIQSLDDQMFANLTKLQTLNLSGNRISALGSNSFKDVGSLMELRLDGNHLGSLPEIFTLTPLVQLNSLVSLNLSNNQIDAYEISFHEFQSVFHNLRDLDLSHNRIFYVKVSRYLKLRRLDLSFNEVPQISVESDWPAESVEELLLNDNQILFIHPHFFSRTQRLRKLYLHNNNLTALHELEFNKNREFHEVTLRGNPWHCDCNLKWLADTVRSGQKFTAETFLSISDNDELTCDREFQKSGKPSSAEVKIADVSDDEEAFLCRFKCTQSVSKKPKCKTPCPAACSCYRNADSTRISVDCSSRDLNRIAEATPNLTTNLYLNSNNLFRVGPKDFQGLQFVETLDISRNSVEDIERGTLDGMPQLSNLQLDHNRLQHLPNDLFKKTKNLKTLNLAHNRLDNLDESLFSPIRHLRTLNLNHNRLSTLSVWTLSDSLPMLTSLTLEQNPWSCECDYAMRFAEWLTNTDIEHLPTRDIQCTDATDVQLQPRMISLLAFNASHCYTSSGRPSRTYLPALIGIISLFLLIILVAVPSFLYRWEMQVLLYHHYGVRLFHRNDDRDDVGKNYDAFVAYTSHDEDFLIRELLPKLEGKERQRQYKLCLHHRNFMPGAFIIDNILEAIEESRRTIVLLTPNFVRSEWCRFEFKSAHMQMLKDRRRRLIVIVVGEIPLDDVDNEMKLYLTTNTYLSWGEKYFWQKLYFALPQ